LVDWKTDYVRIHQKEYPDKFKQLANDNRFSTTIKNYKNLLLPTLDLSNNAISSDMAFLYSRADSLLKPTAASKVLHMYNPNLFPIWDRSMRNNLYRANGHNPHHYVRWISLMQEEINLTLSKTALQHAISFQDAIVKIQELDVPTKSLLRIYDKVNYNQSRTPQNVQAPRTNAIHEIETKGGTTMARIIGGKEDTGLKLSSFIKEHLPQIYSFSMNKVYGFSFEEEQSLWRSGKMTAAFLKQVASMLQYPTFQVSNYDLLQSLKSDRQKLIDLLEKKPELDTTIRIKSKGPKHLGSSSKLKTRLLDE
jgi:uncharacterized protein YdcH (DUF465 family)